MLTVYPDFYDEFHCLASLCRHSCCVGWEIDVDAETLAYYNTLEGPLGKELRESIAREPAPLFRLTAEERCPFLRPDGLCRLILTLGEDSLCDICALHPRFYNELPGRLEMGLGLCCEEAARLLTEGAGPLRLLTEDDGEGEAPPSPLLRRREEIFARLADVSRPLTARMEGSLGLYGETLPPFENREAARFLLTLERMEESWTALLNTLAAAPGEELEPRLSEERYMRLAAYLVYRHFTGAGSEREEARLLRFCFFAVRLVCALEPYSPDALRLFSAEIEYSDENVEKICAWLATHSSTGG